MNQENILSAWIMEEHLTEGDLNIDHKNIRRFEGLNGDDYYSFFKGELKEHKIRPEGGVIIYLDLFGSSSVIQILLSKFHLKDEIEAPANSTKFSVALYFDTNLNFDKDKFFYTESAYIRSTHEIPEEAEFKAKEDDLRQLYAQRFESDSAQSEEEKRAIFNKAMKKCIPNLSACRYELVGNLERGAANLHSFYIDDLEKAKKISTPNFIAYLNGGELSERVNLDSKQDSQGFNPDEFKKILSPVHYPLGRYPSNTKYALSFMQQAAVNLTIGYDNKQMRSVNGPPGTGKTTLLKDIFAELVVRQAHDIANLSEKKIEGTMSTALRKYNGSLGELPDSITRNGILVASSNNSAVQNIVNELPLRADIDEKLLPLLEKADYFKDIANATYKEVFSKEHGYQLNFQENGDKFWGQFSLEGGNSDNMRLLLAKVEAIYENLDSGKYEDDPSVYDEFMSAYEKVAKIREDVDFAANKPSIISRMEYDLQYEKDVYARQKEQKWQAYEALRQKTENRLCQIQAEYVERQGEVNILENRVREAQRIEDDKRSMLEYHQNNKPRFSFFELGRYAEDRRTYREREQYLRTEYEQARANTVSENGKLSAAREKLDQLKEQFRELKERERNERASFASWEENMKHKIAESEKKLDELNAIVPPDVYALDMSLPYDQLQKSNFWFDESYRLEQSKLFILALRVRKQFLYENRKNIRNAKIVWQSQNEYADNKRMILDAWNWINMVIPVISTTFASLGRMLKNIEAEQLGYFFVDEAGQALPQAAVGGIIRCRDTLVVGDPAQIEPVLTLDASVMNLLGKVYKADPRYLSSTASVQALVDSASQYGFYKPDGTWIGIPLWVHRRCNYPMFSISNDLSYNGLMVQGKDTHNLGKAAWFDITGTAHDKYVEQQGDFLMRCIERMSADNPDIIDKTKKDIIYVITPFRNVAEQLARKLEDIHFTRRDGKGKPTNVGTIHTFQGKEAPIVFLVMGADQNSKGAASWAVEKKNMMNVAATRAKNEFYIIGDLELYLGTRQETVLTTVNDIRKYQAEHPELMDRAVEQAGS